MFCIQFKIFRTVVAFGWQDLPVQPGHSSREIVITIEIELVGEMTSRSSSLCSPGNFIFISQ